MATARKKAIVSVYIPHSLKAEIDAMAEETAQFGVKRSTFLARSLEMGSLMMAAIYKELPEIKPLEYAGLRLVMRQAGEYGIFTMLGEEE